MPWGAVHEKLYGIELAPGLEFQLPKEGSPYHNEIQPWLELIDNGKFSEDTLKKTPLSYTTDPKLIELVKKSGETSGWTWLHHLHLGTYETERGDIDSPLQHFSQSMKKLPNPLAARNLGILQQSMEDAIPYFLQAWELTCQLSDNYSVSAKDRLLRNVASEITMFFLKSLPSSKKKLQDFLQSVHENDQQHLGLTNLDNV